MPSQPLSRRTFLSSITAALGTPIIYGKYLPLGLLPVSIANSKQASVLLGKHPELAVLNDKPINAETPAHLLDDLVTPADKLFVRNNGIPPDDVDEASWTLTISGESAGATKTYTLAELKSRFTHHTYQLTLECGGNGRSEFSPPAKGNQWTTGAVGCPKWTGVRLADVLQDVGIKPDAQYIGYYGKDTHISGQPNKHPISRGVPITKALESESLIAWAMNDKPLPMLNGYPLRLVFGGWPASTSGKWLAKIAIRNKEHDGAKMGGYAYRVPCKPVAPGAKVAEEDMCIIHAMPVKSLITSPKSGTPLPYGQVLNVRGHAWAGDKQVSKVHISKDFGQSWQSVALTPPINKNAWQHWHGKVTLADKGYYEIWVKATDSDGVQQPMILPGWNPKGYLNNACHRIAVQVV